MGEQSKGQRCQRCRVLSPSLLLFPQRIIQNSCDRRVENLTLKGNMESISLHPPNPPEGWSSSALVRANAFSDYVIKTWSHRTTQLCFPPGKQNHPGV